MFSIETKIRYSEIVLRPRYLKLTSYTLNYMRENYNLLLLYLTVHL